MNKLPVIPKKNKSPIVAMNRWREIDGKLVKIYLFREDEDRMNFVSSLLNYESKVKHYATMAIEGNRVGIKLYTKDFDRISEIDKEYAKFADVLFRDIVYNTDHGNENKYF